MYLASSVAAAAAAVWDAIRYTASESFASPGVMNAYPVTSTAGADVNVSAVLPSVAVTVPASILASVLMTVRLRSHHQSDLAAMSRYTSLMRFWTFACSVVLLVESRSEFITRVSMAEYVRFAGVLI